MKKLFLTLIILSSYFSFGQLDFTNEKIAHDESHVNSKLQEISGITTKYDIKYHRLEWNLDPNVYFISGTVTTYLVTEEALDKIQFDLNDNMTVSTVQYHGTSLTFNRLTKDVLEITLPASLPKNTLDSVSVTYSGAPANTGFGSFTKGSHAGKSILWTLSEPYGGKDWWPCKNLTNDKIDSVDYVFTTPIGNKVATNGILTNTVIGNTKIAYHWSHKYPITSYLVCFSVTNYAEFTEKMKLGNDSLPILYYVYPEDSAAWKAEAKLVFQFISFYDSLFLPYPYKKEKYGQAQWGWGGGEEHQTMSFVSTLQWDLNAHELAHQWFGDYVTCASFQDIWLNEGFATYLTGLTYERFSPNLYWINWRKLVSDNILTRTNGTVYVKDTNNVNTIFNSRTTYNKGAFVLHMLRWVLGDANFFQGVRNYLNDPKLKYNYVTTDNLKTHLESISGKNLTKFFNDWYYNAGYPIYNVKWKKLGNKQIEVTINQTQSDPSVSFFEMPLPLVFKSGANVQTVVFNNTNQNQIQNFTLNFEPDSLKFDPEIWILSKSSVNQTSSNVDIKNEYKINISPNPVQSMLNVQLTAALKTKIALKIYSVDGKLVFNANENTNSGINQFGIDCASLLNGVYTIQLSFEGKEYAETFIKQ
jgi:aminopeptidase N